MPNLAKLSALPYFMERFHENAVRYPALPMLYDAHHPEGLTRAAVDEGSARVYAYLKRRGVGREDMVMICLPRGADIPIAMIGVWKAGAACTVAEDDLPAERIAFIQRDCRCVLTIDSAAWEEIAQTPPLTGYEKAGDRDAAFAIYTSGSTGEPKGVLHEYGAFRMMAEAGPAPSDRPEDARAETMIPPFNFVVAVGIVQHQMRSLDSMHILPYEISKDPLRLNRYFTEHHITHTFLPPSALRAIGGELSCALRTVFVGGEGANGLSLDGVELWNRYSMSESAFLLCTFPIDRPYALCPVGKPTSELVRLRLLDTDGQEVPDGEEGEICFENPFFRGYINRPEETRAAFRGGLFHSGDLGKWDENGNLIVTGRAGDMIKIGGNRVEPSEIEAAFRKVTGHVWCAVKGFTAGTRTLLCLYYQGESKLDARRVRERLRESLPDYMIPAVFRRVETVPMLPNGKTDKSALPEPGFNEDRPAYAAPVTVEETALCRAFEAAFALAPIGLDDDFFDLGGDSLTAMSLLAEAELPGMSVLDIFEGRTPRAIARMLAQRQAENAVEDFALAERRERQRVHPMPPTVSIWLAKENPGDFHLPGLIRFDPAVDAQRLCDALNRAVANRSALSMVVEKDGAGKQFLRYDASVTPHYEVQRLTQAEFDAKRPSLIQTFELYGTPLIHAGVYETEHNVYLFVDVHHMVMDGGAMKLLNDDIARAYRGETPEQDTYCAQLARQEREEATPRYQMAKESLLRLFNDESWRIGFLPDRSDGPHSISVMPCRRILTVPELDTLSQRLGMSRSLLCVGLTLLAAAKLEGAGKILCLSAFHNRSDDLSRNAFGCLATVTTAAVELRPASSVAGFFTDLKASWVNDVANLSAAVEAMASSPRGISMLQATFQSYEVMGNNGLAALGGTAEEKLIRMDGGNLFDQLCLYKEQPGMVVPLLAFNQKWYSPEKMAAILDTLGTVIDRLLALERPEETTVGELLA